MTIIVPGDSVRDVTIQEVNHDEVFRYEALRVSKDRYIKIDTNKYSVSPEMSGKIVQTKIYFDKIEVFFDHSLLKTFSRSYGKNDEDSNWKDYLPSLIKKPGAVEHTRFFDQMPKLWQKYMQGILKAGASPQINRTLEQNSAVKLSA